MWWGTVGRLEDGSGAARFGTRACVKVAREGMDGTWTVDVEVREVEPGAGECLRWQLRSGGHRRWYRGIMRCAVAEGI